MWCCYCDLSRRERFLFINTRWCSWCLIPIHSNERMIPRISNKINPGHFSLAATAQKPQQISMFLHVSTWVWGRRWYPHRTEGFCDKTAINHQLKRMCVPDCAYTDNMFINVIHISLYDISPRQNISYQIKETWLHERDSDAPSVSSEPGGK